MVNTSYTRRPSEPKPGRLFVLALISFTITVITGAVLLVALNSVAASGKIQDGVAVNYIDVSGLTVQEAELAISNRLTYPATGRIVLMYADQSWIASPTELGFLLDPHASAVTAFNSSRDNNPFGFIISALRNQVAGTNLPPVLVYDQSAAQDYLLRLAGQINRPAKEAGINISGVEVSTTPGQVGHELDLAANLELISRQLATLQDGAINLVVNETSPTLIDAEPLADQARMILSAPLDLTLAGEISGDPGPWVIEPAALAGILSIVADPANPAYPYRVTVNRESLRAYLEGIAPEIERSPANARFIFNDDTRQLDLKEASTDGRSVDVDGTLDDIIQGLAAGSHQVPLRLVVTRPEVADTATGADLGITELVMAETSYFYGSSADRIHNIRVAAANFHGLLIAPGEEFSMAGAMKDVTLDNGYTEALIIYGDQTIKGVGGGVCQVSTTLFRTAFMSGFPITERYAHAYRVGYYEQTASGARDPNLAGLDATVFIPVVDFRFVNDTPYWLLMETYSTDTSLTWKFYSTRDGRTVEWQNSGLQNVVEAPKPLYRLNPDLAKNKFKQIDYEADGADILVTRIVYRDGSIYFQDAFNTHYAPWQAVWEYGPDSKLPKGIIVEE